MARRKKITIWQLLGLGMIFIISATLPRVIYNLKHQVQPTYEFDLWQIGRVPMIQPTLAATASAFLQSIDSQHILVTDLDSGATLLEKDALTPAFPASTTKMLTAVVAKENFALDQVLTITEAALINGNNLKFKAGEQLTASHLLKALLISSNNEAAEAFALNYPAGREEFVNKMNQRAREMNLSQSLFVNPSGFDGENVYSTAHDLTILARELLKDDFLKLVVGTKRLTIADVTGKTQHALTNTNELLFELPEVTGVKTGTTDGAGQVLVTLVEKDQTQVLIVVMGSQDRYADTKKIITWVDEAYDWVDVDVNNLIN